ncbi:MAG: sulfatase [Thermodesulfobacteriota bacterium]
MKNVILLTIDTLRKDMLGCYGSDKQLTPFIDSIQNRCTRFLRAMSPGSYTQAAFPGILTSSYYLDYGYSKEKKFNPNRVLVSEPLRRQGITTAGFHSNAYLCAYFGWNRGWNVFYDSMESDVTDQRPYIEARALNEKVYRWVSTRRGKDLPFFLWVHYMDVHEPYVPERRYVDLVDPTIRLGEDEMFALFKTVLLKRDVSNRETVDLLRSLYMAGVRKVDDATREFFGTLERTCLLQNSYVILTADHGDEFGEHGGISHDGKMYSELVEVPLMIYDPDLSEGRSCDKVVSTVDIPPTILHLFGLEPIGKFQGRSLLPTEGYPPGIGAYGEGVDKYGEKEKGDEYPIYYYREEDLKISYRERGDAWEMYDLARDPAERENLVADAPQAEEMKEKLRPRIGRWAKA